MWNSRKLSFVFIITGFLFYATAMAEEKDSEIKYYLERGESKGNWLIWVEKDRKNAISENRIWLPWDGTASKYSAIDQLSKIRYRQNANDKEVKQVRTFFNGKTELIEKTGSLPTFETYQGNAKLNPLTSLEALEALRWAKVPVTETLNQRLWSDARREGAELGELIKKYTLPRPDPDAPKIGETVILKTRHAPNTIAIIEDVFQDGRIEVRQHPDGRPLGKVTTFDYAEYDVVDDPSNGRIQHRKVWSWIDYQDQWKREFQERKVQYSGKQGMVLTGDETGPYAAMLALDPEEYQTMRPEKMVLKRPHGTFLEGFKLPEVGQKVILLRRNVIGEIVEVHDDGRTTVEYTPIGQTAPPLARPNPRRETFDLDEYDVVTDKFKSVKPGDTIYVSHWAESMRTRIWQKRKVSHVGREGSLLAGDDNRGKNAVAVHPGYYSLTRPLAMKVPEPLFELNPKNTYERKVEVREYQPESGTPQVDGIFEGGPVLTSNGRLAIVLAINSEAHRARLFIRGINHREADQEFTADTTKLYGPISQPHGVPKVGDVAQHRLDGKVWVTQYFRNAYTQKVKVGSGDKSYAIEQIQVPHSSTSGRKGLHRMELARKMRALVDGCHIGDPQ